MTKNTFLAIYETLKFDKVENVRLHISNGDTFLVDMPDLKLNLSYISAVPVNMDEGTVFIPYEEIQYIAI